MSRPRALSSARAQNTARAARHRHHKSLPGTSAGSGLDLRQQCPRLLEAGDEAHTPGKCQLDLELAAHQLLRELLLPTEQGEQVAFRHQGHGAVFDVLERKRIVFGCNCVLDSLAPKLARTVPAIGPAIDLRKLVGHLGAQPIQAENRAADGGSDTSSRVRPAERAGTDRAPALPASRRRRACRRPRCTRSRSSGREWTSSAGSRQQAPAR